MDDCEYGEQPIEDDDEEPSSSCSSDAKSDDFSNDSYDSEDSSEGIDEELEDERLNQDEEEGAFDGTTIDGSQNKDPTSSPSTTSDGNKFCSSRRGIAITCFCILIVCLVAIFATGGGGDDDESELPAPVPSPTPTGTPTIFASKGTIQPIVTLAPTNLETNLEPSSSASPLFTASPTPGTTRSPVDSLPNGGDDDGPLSFGRSFSLDYDKVCVDKQPSDFSFGINPEDEDGSPVFSLYPPLEHSFQGYPVEDGFPDTLRLILGAFQVLSNGAAGTTNSNQFVVSGADLCINNNGGEINFDQIDTIGISLLGSAMSGSFSLGETDYVFQLPDVQFYYSSQNNSPSFALYVDFTGGDDDDLPSIGTNGTINLLRPLISRLLNGNQQGSDLWVYFHYLPDQEPKTQVSAGLTMKQDVSVSLAITERGAEAQASFDVSFLSGITMKGGVRLDQGEEQFYFAAGVDFSMALRLVEFTFEITSEFSFTRTEESTSRILTFEVDAYACIPSRGILNAVSDSDYCAMAGAILTIVLPDPGNSTDTTGSSELCLEEVKLYSWTFGNICFDPDAPKILDNITYDQIRVEVEEFFDSTSESIDTVFGSNLANNETCRLDRVCASGRCEGGVISFDDNSVGKCSEKLSDWSNCDYDSDCKSSFCNNNTCREQLELNEPCTSNRHCKTGRCVPPEDDTIENKTIAGCKTCQNSTTDGTCFFDSDCGEEHHCKHWKCAPKQGDGTDCFQDSDCLSGRCDAPDGEFSLDGGWKCNEKVEETGDCNEDSDCASNICTSNFGGTGVCIDAWPSRCDEGEDDACAGTPTPSRCRQLPGGFLTRCWQSDFLVPAGEPCEWDLNCWSGKCDLNDDDDEDGTKICQQESQQEIILT